MIAPCWILDTETTGKSEPAIIEFAFADVVAVPGANGMLFNLGEPTVQRYKPNKPIELGAMAAHHIIESDLADCPSTPERFDLPQVIIGHNVDYDWKALGGPAETRRICTYALAREAWPGLDSYSLGALTYHLHQPSAARDMLRDAHSAAVDIDLCFKVFTAALSILLPSPKSWTDIWRVSEAARVPEEMPFGKHRGLPIADVPGSWVTWLMGEHEKAVAAKREEDQVDPYLIQAFKDAGLA